MKRFALLLTVLLLLGIARSATATIRYVDSVSGENHFTTITAAYTAAIDGDTLLIAIGNYDEDLSIYKDLVIIGCGIDPAANTKIIGRTRIYEGSVHIEGVYLSCIGNYPVEARASGETLRITRSRLYCNDRSAIHALDVLLQVEDCYISVANGGTNYGCITSTGTELEVRNTIFGNHAASSLHVLKSQPVSVVFQNCVVLNFRTFANLTGAFPILISNSIFADWHNDTPNWGTLPASASWEYNASENEAPPGTAALLLAESPFVAYNQSTWDYEQFDLHLDPVSGLPCIDSGQPALQDLDGSPCDRGVYGGLRPFIENGAPNFPYVSSLTVPGAIMVGDPLPIEATGRIGREY